MGRGGLAKKLVKMERGMRFCNHNKKEKNQLFFQFFWSRFFWTRIWAESWVAAPPGVAQAKGGPAPKGKNSFLSRFRELRGCTYHFYHQNHGGDGCRARYFGPTGPGCGDMPNFGAKILNYNFPGRKGPKWAIFGCISGISPP